VCQFGYVRLLRCPLAIVLTPLIAFGCTSWQAVAVTPQVLIENEHPKTIRVTRAGRTDAVFAGIDSAKIVVHSRTTHEVQWPFIAGDTLRGLSGRDSFTVALRDITRVQVSRFDWRLTGIGLALLTLGALLVWYVNACEESGFC